MTVYAVGDVHGCYRTLEELLKKLPEDGKLLFLGDLINRGPDSLKCIRRAMAFGKRCVPMIGNHELHLLGVAAGVRKMHPADTLSEILEAGDRDEILDWVRKGRLAVLHKDFLCVHAAPHWSWDAAETLRHAAEVEEVLSDSRWEKHIGDLFGKEQWSEDLRGDKRRRAIINVLTRTRFLEPTGEMNYAAKLSPAATGGGLIPWFEYPGRRTADKEVVFGHWSTLGETGRPHVYCLDGGCLWGGSLRAMSLNKEKSRFEAASSGYLSPDAV
jgi:bis(5'-nucleosyl)-tetraphosphatase (symmetrical)